MRTVQNKGIRKMSNKIAIVTGANSGIGYETTLGLVKMNIKVIMACRSSEKGQKAKDRILEVIPSANLEIMNLDLSRLSSVREFVKNYKKGYLHLNLLINNAGVFYIPYTKTVDGFECQLETNYLGHFLLTSLLLDLMPDTSESRVVSLSSNGHKKGEINFDDLQSKKKYNPLVAYNQSKLACLMFADELNRLLKVEGRKILSVSAHPGVSLTNIGRYTPKFTFILLRYTILPFITHQPTEAAKPILLAILGPNVKGGEYFGPQGFREMIGKAGIAAKAKHAQDRKIAKRLWEVSEELTSSKFNLKEGEKSEKTYSEAVISVC
jgi:NAD(P)-dependent dehydrogenase (short-subunit alcohol dehydrogenase family)